MANTLTGIIPTLYEALNVISREMVGMIPAVRRDSNAERAAVGQTVRVPLGESGALEDIVPGADPANSGDTTVGYTDVTISKPKAAPVRWNGEEQRAVGTAGVYNQVLADQFTDAMRKLVNAVEIDLAIAGKVGASRAYGTAGTTPFGTAGDLSDVAGVLQILEDNGAPKSDLQLALGSMAMSHLRGKQSVLFKVNEAGSSDMLRNGMTDRLQGFALRNSAGIVTHTAGTGASYVTSGSTAIGVGDIALVTGTGTVLAGDVVSFAADAARKYVVGKGVTAPGTITINKPGSRIVIPTANALRAISSPTSTMPRPLSLRTPTRGSAPLAGSCREPRRTTTPRRLVDADKLREASKLRSCLRAAYAAAIRARQDARSLPALRTLRIITNPARDIVTIEGASNARDRALSIAELRAYWKRIEVLPDPDGALLRFHLLTGGQRLEQLARLTSDDTDSNTITLKDGKGRRRRPRIHVIPLIPAAQTALAAMREGDNGEHVFTVTGGLSGAVYAVAQNRLKGVVAAMADAGELEKGAFTMGDLRRTVETRLAAEGVSAEIRAQLQSHGLGGVQARHYGHVDRVRRIAVGEFLLRYQPQQG